ncbi:hypothetical protein BRC65_01920 [Halobacteriales archaeon QH_2_65_14]|nr:MAG: hypothetical protein BRC65_01920 [Halobacteriales archaeon QH_2_65_14]
MDTWYSERGSEMKVYAPQDESLVMFAGRDKQSTFRRLLDRVAGIFALLLPPSILVGLLANRTATTTGSPFDLFPGSGSSDDDADGGTGDDGGGSDSSEGMGDDSGDMDGDSADEDGMNGADTEGDGATQSEDMSGDADGGDDAGAGPERVMRPPPMPIRRPIRRRPRMRYPLRRGRSTLPTSTRRTRPSTRTKLTSLPPATTTPTWSPATTKPSTW